MSAEITIKVDGRVADLLSDLIEVVVDTNLFMPAMCTIKLHDELDRRNDKLTYTDSQSPFKVGAELRIDVETGDLPEEANPVRATLFIGEITALEPSFSVESIPVLTVRCYDRLHHLSRGKKTRTYGDANPTGAGITLDQIINTIVQETPAITAKEVDPSVSSMKYTYVLQYNQTDFEFLGDRARALGCQLYVDDKKLYFVKADEHRGQPSDKPGKLTWRMETLRSFEPRLTLMHQVDKSIVKGWDGSKKEPIEGTGAADRSKTVPQVKLNTIGLKATGGDSAKSAFKGSAETVIVNRPMATIDEAKAIATAQLARLGSEYVQAEGMCDVADPRLIAGRLVTIEGVGQTFSGDYYVTEARHVWWGHGRYRLTFKVSGRNPSTLSHLLHKQGNGQSPPDVVHGVVTAKVTNLQDPEALGRVQVMYPWLPKYKNADLSSNWARLASPMGGKDSGFYFIPEIDDEVLVAFEHGDMNRPYIVGTLWNSQDKPPQGTGEALASDKKKVDQRILRSRSGHLIALTDKQGAESILIQDKSEKNSIFIDTKTKAMTIKAEGDITIDAGGKLIVKSKQDMSFTSMAKVKMKATADFDVQATGKGSFKSNTQLLLEGTAKSELKGAMVSVNGNATTEVKGGAMVQVQAGIIKLN